MTGRQHPVLTCCALQHRFTRFPVPAERIIDNVRSAIWYLDIQYGNKNPRMAAAADRLRDFATVELLCADLGITRKDIS